MKSAKRPTKKALMEREMQIVAELQANHGWMFFDLKESERWTMLFRRVNGKHTLTPGRKTGVAMPDTSPVAVALEEASKAKRKAKRRKS